MGAQDSLGRTLLVKLVAQRPDELGHEIRSYGIHPVGFSG